MKIVGVSFYQGVFKDSGTGSFRILVEEPKRYVLMDVKKDGNEVLQVFNESQIQGKFEDFPLIIGKFDSEIIALEDPVDTGEYISYKVIEATLDEYFNSKGQAFDVVEVENEVIFRS